MSALKTLQDRARERVGTVVKEKWALEGLLGVGGTAAVYSATHRNGKRAAIKMLHAELTNNADLTARFLREGYVANKIGHAGAVSVLDDDRCDDGAVFLVMELLDGLSLDRYTRRDGERLSAREVMRVGDQMLDVLASAHAKGVVHRDIKPANIFLTRDGQVKVLDFGIARLAELQGNDATATQTGAAIGTPAFMPPEQARGRWNLVDARTDLWAVGATLFALLTGQRPRRAETVNEELLLAMTQPMPPLASVMPNVPSVVAQVIDRALAFDIEHRWPDARSMQAALRVASDAFHSEFVPSMVSAVVGVDTAPVIRPDQPPPELATLATPTPVPEHLTTSRPFVHDPMVSAAPTQRTASVGKVIAVAAAAFTIVMAVGLGAMLVHSRPTSGTQRPAATTPVVTAPIIAPIVVPTVQSPAVPITPTPITPTTSSAVPSAKSTAAAPTTTFRATAPRASASTQPSMFDQRF